MTQEKNLLASAARDGFYLFVPALIFFFFSGAAGLLYQVVWTRQLALLFGVTHHAVATVLSIFFLGLALGSLIGGRWADRARSPLLWYGVCELVIAAWAVVFLLVFTQGEDGIAAILRAAGENRVFSIVLRAALALVLLFVPVFLMGATLPLLSRHVTRAGGAAGMRIGLLYSVNTLGAMAGCALTGFYFLEHYGYTRTTLIGAAMNAGIGVVAMALAWGVRVPEGIAKEKDLRDEKELKEPQSKSLGVAVLAGFALSGFCFLALEVIWTRLLAIIFLGTTYAYATMLVVVLLGIGMGGAVGAFIARRSNQPAAWLANVFLVSGLFAFAQLSTFASLPQQLIDAPGGAWEAELQTKFLLAAKALLPFTLTMGATFPLALQVIARTGTLGRDVGRVYALNTLGGVVGSLVGGFVLLPLLGSHYSIFVMGCLLLGASFAIHLALGRSRVLLAIAIPALALCFFALGPRNVNTALNVGYIPDSHEILTVREGTEGTVVVSQPEGDTTGSNRVLWINRVQATASIERGVRMNRMQGALPHLFDRDVRNILFMCFGSGVTCGTLALGGFEHIDAVEISPDVLAVAPLFDADNLGVLNRPGIDFHIDDGRNYLMVSQAEYDFITFEPMPLAVAGVSTFYTREYYELCLTHLAPRGMVSQWVPLHALNPDVVRSLAATFTQVFPHSCAWFINADLFLIGSNAPLLLDPEFAREKLSNPELQTALERAGFTDIEELYACFAMDDAALRSFADGGESMSDDRPWAEFIAPRLVYGRTVDESLAALQQHLRGPGELLVAAAQGTEIAKRIARRHAARVHDFEGLMAYYGGATIGSEAFDSFDASLDIDPDHFNSKYYLKQIALQQSDRYIAWEMWDKARTILERAARRMPEDVELKAMLKRLEEEEAARGK